MIKRRFAVLPGDGIGVDVTNEVRKVLYEVASLQSFELETKEFDYGAERKFHR